MEFVIEDRAKNNLFEFKQRRGASFGTHAEQGSLPAVQHEASQQSRGSLLADGSLFLRRRDALLEVVIPRFKLRGLPKYTGKFHYDIVKGNAAQLTLTLPASQALTKLDGAQIRDWHTTAEGDRQTLTVEFIKPVENS